MIQSQVFMWHMNAHITTIIQLIILITSNRKHTVMVSGCLSVRLTFSLTSLSRTQDAYSEAGSPGVSTDVVIWCGWCEYREHSRMACLDLAPSTWTRVVRTEHPACPCSHSRSSFWSSPNQSQSSSWTSSCRQCCCWSLALSCMV